MITPSPPTLTKATGLLFALLGAATATANQIVDEHTRLATVLRELKAIERLVAADDFIKAPETARYHFDYVRLRMDIHRVSTGIKDYLSPKRASPRDAGALYGSYFDETVPHQ
ncbi:RAQPRD family integrative conjugative element protein [Pseudomonas sp. NFACC45]|uniref:integrative conjugative element protein, RAQPRD family n=1 Tax=Pseudomonas sp. NFACC45 TaxID=1566201 RepID=UPI0008E45C09|nr:RAQPRD family integrative conjugative element protein [Pseudomonas sp. NFACC45]SFH38591.1 integrative conjugative element protein, RAQPRD family [Pseudomonas sp. NFACC45]